MGKKGRNEKKQEEMGKNVKNGKKRKKMERNRKKQEETGRNGKNKKETGSHFQPSSYVFLNLIDIKVLQPLLTEQNEYKQAIKQIRTVTSRPSSH